MEKEPQRAIEELKLAHKQQLQRRLDSSDAILQRMHKDKNEEEKFITDKQCLPDQILPEDIAQLALFLASDAGRMCTRRNFFMDAGIGA